MANKILKQKYRQNNFYFLQLGWLDYGPIANIANIWKSNKPRATDKEMKVKLETHTQTRRIEKCDETERVLQPEQK